MDKALTQQKNLSYAESHLPDGCVTLHAPDIQKGVGGAEGTDRWGAKSYPLISRPLWCAGLPA